MIGVLGSSSLVAKLRAVLRHLPPSLSYGIAALEVQVSRVFLRTPHSHGFVSLVYCSLVLESGTASSGQASGGRVGDHCQHDGEVVLYEGSALCLNSLQCRQSEHVRGYGERVTL